MSTEPKRYQVTLQDPWGQERISVAEHQSILDAALRAGLDLPNSCCQGWCLTCAGRILEGRVEHPHARRYFRQDAEAGFVLICTAEPRSDCLIQTHQSQRMKQFRRRHRLPTPGG